MQKTYNNLILLLIFLSFFSFVNAKGISFFISEDHELFPKVDSLYRSMNSIENEYLSLEKQVIRDASVRNDKINVKGEYLNFALDNNIIDTETIKNYCKSLNGMLCAKEAYFSTLLSALEGDERALCFNFIKKIKSNISDAVIIERNFNEKTFVQEKPSFGKNDVALQIEDNLNGGLEDILIDDKEVYNYTHEIKVEERENIKDTSEVIILTSTSDNSIAELEVNNENESMINSMVDFFNLESDVKSEDSENLNHQNN